jgi:hypothetical protein
MPTQNCGSWGVTTEPKKRSVQALHLVLPRCSKGEHVLGETLGVRMTEFDRLRRLGTSEVLGQHIGELQTREGLSVERPVTVIDACRSDPSLEPARVRLAQAVGLCSHKEHDLCTAPTLPLAQFALVRLAGWSSTAPLRHSAVDR